MMSERIDVIPDRKRQPQTMEVSWDRYTQWLRSEATSDFGRYCKGQFTIPEVEEAEATFDELLQKIDDPQLRNDIDDAAGMIACAYEILGYCAGYFSTEAQSRDAFF